MDISQQFFVLLIFVSLLSVYFIKFDSLVIHIFLFIFGIIFGALSFQYSEIIFYPYTQLFFLFLNIILNFIKILKDTKV